MNQINSGAREFNKSYEALEIEQIRWKRELK